MEPTAVQKKVLIVDDSPAQVKLIQGLLEPEGYWPVGLSDPRRVEEAITVERPNVILLDVVMPERNGFQVCRELKGNVKYNAIPVILVTSKDTASDRYWGQQQGAEPDEVAKIGDRSRGPDPPRNSVREDCMVPNGFAVAHLRTLAVVPVP